MILAFMYISILYLKSVCVSDVRVTVNFFPYRYPVIPAPFVEKIFLHLLDCFDAFVENHDCICGGLFLGPSILFH